MKTSRIALWILCLALVASCTKNGNTGDDVPENGFRAKIEQTKGGGSKGERTHINPEWDPNGYSETPLYWSEGDLIKVSNQSGTTLTFQLTEGENTMYGTFYTGEQNDGFFEPDWPMPKALQPPSAAALPRSACSPRSRTRRTPSTKVPCPWWPARARRRSISATCSVACAFPLLFKAEAYW